MSKLRNIYNIFRFSNSLQLLVNRALFGRIGLTVYRHGKLQFLVDHHAGDQDGPRSCVEPGLYDPFFEVIQWHGPVTFLDLGANAGGFILGLLKNGYSINKGVAVELNPLTWARLIYNIYANVPLASERIEILNGAVAGAGGTLDICLGDGSVADSVAGCATGTLYHLACYTLPSLIARFAGRTIDLLKIDIEGSEYELLAVTPDCLATVRYLLIEIHSVQDRNEAEVHAWVRRCGFSQVRSSRPSIEPNVYLFRNDLLRVSEASNP